MNKMSLDIPAQIETERLYMRCYQAGDGPWYYSVSQKNRAHLQRYEPDNVVMSIHSEQQAEIVVRELAAEWAARNCFFMGAFAKTTKEFVAQIYIGPVDWTLPEFEIGYFADIDHQGHGFVTEAVKAALGFCFEHLRAHRVRIECDHTNLRSRRVAERCGLIQEAHFRENKKHPDGSLSGTLYFGLLRSERPPTLGYPD
ncbi:MAG: GNAT family protein [Anaerolineae bacterium]|jgi:RimJ/RimL family protein N-acetyltransferase